MKIACLISGLPRSIKYNIEKIKNILREDIDYFVHVTKKYDDNYKNLDINYDEIIKKLNPKVSIHENEVYIDDNESKYINMKRQWYKFNQINNARINYEKIHNIKYDLIIRIRPDLHILDNEINFEETKDGIIYGNNDELFYGNSETINEISNLIYNFDYLSNLSIEKKVDYFYKYLDMKKIKLQKNNINYKLILTECNIIGISGDSGCGKTTLIKNLEMLFKKDILKIEGDRYHKWERGDENWKKYTHLNPEANYICKFREDTFNLKIGQDIYQVDYDHSTGKFTEKEELKSCNNILMCGLHTLYDKHTNKLFNMKIFLDTDINLKYYWKIKRDVEHRGYSVSQVLEKIKQREGDNKLYIEPQKNNSDIIIRFFTDDNFNYLILDENPNIYLKITSNKKIYKFIEALNKFEIPYSFLKEEIDTYSLVFYKISNFIPLLIHFSKNEIKISKNDYYTLITSFVLFFNQ